jgi:Caspase recruitment domain
MHADVISSDFDINSQHIGLIRQKYTFLLEQLNPQDSGLIAMLYEKKVIDQQEKGTLESGESAIRQTERLLSILSRKSMEQFGQFLVALDQTGHKHVVNELRRGQPLIETSGS